MINLTARPAVVIPLSFVLAFIAVTVVQRVVPSGWKDTAALCAAWISFYPISRLKPNIPWWWHWVEGAFIGIGFWTFKHFSR